MSKANNLTDFLTGIANAIRAKKGTSATINPQDFGTEIAGLSGKLKEYVHGTTVVTAQDLAGVTQIAPSRFRNDGSLQSITIPDTVNTIGANAFNNWDLSSYGNAPLTNIDIGSGITSIGRYAFRNNGNKGTLTITIRATTPPTLVNKDAFNSTINFIIYVPAASVDAYKAATNWSNYASKIQAIPS